MPVLFANNATSTLAASIVGGDLTITVQAGHASRFPSPSGGDWFPVTIADTGGNIEIVKCTARAGAALTVARAQEGTTAQAFAAGSSVALRPTAAALAGILVDRLGGFGELVTDWNNAGISGWYRGNGASNAPETPGWAVAHVVAIDADNVTQFAHMITADADADSKTYRREKNSGSWESWRRCRMTQTELDARYLAISGFTGAAILAALLPVDGAGTGLDADLLDGNQAAAFLMKSGGQMTSGLSFQNATAAAPGDLANHIAIFGTSYGWSYTANSLNHVVGAAGEHKFYIGVTQRLRITSDNLLRDGSYVIRDAGNTPDGTDALAAAGADAVQRTWTAQNLKAAAQASIYGSSDAGYTAYPIGSILIARGPSTARNATVSVYTYNGNSNEFTIASGDADSAAFTGTWKCRGHMTVTGGADFLLVQRVA